MPRSMRDIAKLAGVSSATVSRVLNGSSLVTAETARRVRKIIEDQGFVPNTSAITLKYGRSNTFGVIIPDIANPFFTEFVKIFEALLVEHDQELLVANTDFHPTRMQQSVRRMLLRRVDGVVLLTSEVESEPFESLIRNKIPVVTTDRYLVANGHSDIKIDFKKGLDLVVAHLNDLGHRRIGFIGGSEGLITSRVRRESFLEAMLKRGLTCLDGWLQDGDYKIGGGSAAMEKILSLPERPTAIATANDLTAIGALRTAHAHGLNIPGDLSIVGCDDIEMSDIVYPPLTTIHTSRKDYAEMLFHALRRIQKDASLPGKEYTLGTSLVVRKSTGPAKSTSMASGGRRKR